MPGEKPRSGSRDEVRKFGPLSRGKPAPFFGLELPALMGEDKYLADVFKEIHKTAGVAGYRLIGLHAAAALFHHYAIRDNTLRRMLPFRD